MAQRALNTRLCRRVTWQLSRHCGLGEN
jgi:hypothetical protein